MILQKVQMNRDGNSETVPFYTHAYITTQTTTLVKTGQGLLHSITVNNPVATGTIELDDAVTNTNPFAIITTQSGVVAPVTFIYDIVFNTGLSITTAVENQNITISYN